MGEGQLLIAMLISFINIDMKHPIYGFLMSNNRVSEVVTLITNTFAKKFAHDVLPMFPLAWPGHTYLYISFYLLGFYPSS